MEIQMSLKAVLFDFGGTLDSDGVAWPQRFFPIYRELGVAADWDPFLKAFYRSDDALPERHPLPGLDLHRTIELQALGVLELLAPERTRLAGEVARRFCADSRAQFERNRPLLAALRARFKLGIVSNFYGNLQGILDAAGLGPLFDCVGDSGVVGKIKPDPEFFRHVLGRLEVAPDEALMVGDSLSRDIRGAEGLGMAHAWVDPAGQGPCCPSGRSVRSLTELADLGVALPA
ncbi:MAG: HAD family hydrolase [Elusimicrobia bacterium]|nr:HAD family hydrolase [Elusimicrobiota bacterium]